MTLSRPFSTRSTVNNDTSSTYTPTSFTCSNSRDWQPMTSSNCYDLFTTVLKYILYIMYVA